MASEEKVSESKAARVVYAEFDAWIQESGELFDTTHADLAKEKNIFNEKASYEPLPMLVGRGRLFPGLERSLEKAEVGKEYEVTLPPEDAAGPRDPKLVELFPIREFLRQEIVPEVGLQVTVKNKVGYISAVTAGRVRVDFNNRLAGKTLRYKYRITSEPKDAKEKFEAVLKMDYGNAEGFSFEMQNNKIVVKLPDVCKYDQKWLLSKYRVVTDLRDVMGADVIQFVEEYTKAPSKEEPATIAPGHEHSTHEHDEKKPEKDRPTEEIIE
ncbi:MAG: peptidylprolyl isomerase [Thermoplasmata archaeon]